MSASPADRTPGQTPNGGPRPAMRRPKKADPLVRPKDKIKKRPEPTPSAETNGAVKVQNHGLTVPGQAKSQVLAQHPPKQATSNPTRQSPSLYDDSVVIPSGFSSPQVAPYKDFPLVTTKRALMEDMRLHVARFSSKRMVDPRNQEEFTRPVRLHRRDPRAPVASGGAVKDEDSAMRGMSSQDMQDQKEREQQQILRAERDAQREADMAQVAPSVKGGQKPGNRQKKTQQVFRNDQTEEQKAESKLRYEEALPWHLEDFDNKHKWVGGFEAALSDTYAMLIQGPDGKFRMAPVDKWYKFTAIRKTRADLEEAEKKRRNRLDNARWVKDARKAIRSQTTEGEEKTKSRGLFVGKLPTKADEGPGLRGPGGDDDADQLDFEEDRFADDEENPMFDNDDEEAKEAEDRIKKDQLQANVFETKDEEQYDKAEEKEVKEKEVKKKHGKKVRKALMKREKNYIYDSDSDNPYSEDSESSDSEAERLREEERKKEEEKKATLLAEKEKPKPSGASTKGTNTPSGRPSKHLDPLQRSISATSLKRSGSPNLSEASGNESSRKKHKKDHATSGTSTPIPPPSRPMSPAIHASSQSKATSTKPTANRPDHKRPRLQGAGSGSDAEGAGSGGEMSDGSRKRIRLQLSKPASPEGSPRNSRAGSPEVTAQGTTRAGSPGILPFPTEAELREIIPPEGTSMSKILEKVKGRMHGRKDDFTAMLKKVAKYDKATKLLKPVPQR